MEQSKPAEEHRAFPAFRPAPEARTTAAEAASISSLA